MNEERTGCIYKITCLINGKIYIGLTIQALKRRFGQHISNPCKKLKIDIDKYGRENFEIEAITINDIKETNLPIAEIYYISIYNPEYNTAKGGGNYRVHLIGEANGNSKISDKNCKLLKEEYNKGGIIIEDLANKFDISKTQTTRILHGESRGSSEGPIVVKNKRLNKKEAKQIRIYLYNKTKSKEDIINLYNIQIRQVNRIQTGERWNNAGGPIKGVDY